MQEKIKIAVASDHAGFDLKSDLIKFLEELGTQVQDLGTDSSDSVDYPDFGKAVGKAVSKGQAEVGLCICGSGIGIAMAANKVKGVRAAVVYDTTTAKLARAHNDANVICLGSRLIGLESAKECLQTFLETEFEGGRHQVRVKKLS